MICGNKLFNIAIRLDKKCKSGVETEFQFLNRSGLKFSRNIRRLIEKWIRHYPRKERKELVSRFRDNSDSSFYNTFFELYLHELLLKLGYKVEIHPTIHGTSKKPDFLVLKKREPIFYLEARNKRISHEDVGTEKRRKAAIETLDSITNSNFFLGISILKSAKSPPRSSKWRSFLEKELLQLNPDDVEKEYEETGELPSWKLESNGWIVQISALPRSIRAREDTEIRPVGVEFFGYWELDEHFQIRDAIKSKAGRYGKLDLPYIIAVNIFSFFFRERQIVDALFGEEVIREIRNSKGIIRYIHTRKENGVFRGPEGEQYTRVSAILCVPLLSHTTFSKANPTIWHNPWALKPLCDESFPFQQNYYIEESDNFRIEEETIRGNVFGIPKEWPFLNEGDESS